MAKQNSGSTDFALAVAGVLMIGLIAYSCTARRGGGDTPPTPHPTSSMQMEETKRP